MEIKRNIFEKEYEKIYIKNKNKNEIKNEMEIPKVIKNYLESMEDVF